MNYQSLNCKDGLIFSGPILCKPKIYKDNRGYFYESWNKQDFNNINQKETVFVQDNESYSIHGVLRGLHYQLNPKAQGKLIKVVQGRIFDVFVDIRSESNTFKKSFGIEINDRNKYQLWIPEGFAHGFLTLSEYAVVTYKTTNHWSKELERTILWNDAELNINWPMNQLTQKKPILSNKDSLGKELEYYLRIGEIFK